MLKVPPAKGSKVLPITFVPDQVPPAGVAVRVTAALSIHNCGTGLILICGRGLIFIDMVLIEAHSFAFGEKVYIEGPFTVVLINGGSQLPTIGGLLVLNAGKVGGISPLQNGPIPSKDGIVGAVILIDIVAGPAH